MIEVEMAGGGDELAALMALLLRTTVGPMDVTSPGARRLHTVTSGHQRTLVARFAREPDAELFRRAGPALGRLIPGVTEVLADHRDDGTGHCKECGQVVDCRTRTALERAIAGPGTRR